jgi:hypothetical protein
MCKRRPLLEQFKTINTFATPPSNTDAVFTPPSGDRVCTQCTAPVPAPVPVPVVPVPVPVPVYLPVTRAVTRPPQAPRRNRNVNGTGDALWPLCAPHPAQNDLATCHTHTNMVRWPLLTHSMSCSCYHRPCDRVGLAPSFSATQGRIPRRTALARAVQYSSVTRAPWASPALGSSAACPQIRVLLQGY